MSSYWWRAFCQEMAAEPEAFRRQGDLPSSLARTVRRFGSTATADFLCEPQFAFWREPDPLRVIAEVDTFAAALVLVPWRR